MKCTNKKPCLLVFLAVFAIIAIPAAIAWKLARDAE